MTASTEKVFFGFAMRWMFPETYEEMRTASIAACIELC